MVSETVKANLVPVAKCMGSLLWSSMFGHVMISIVAWGALVSLWSGSWIPVLKAAAVAAVMTLALAGGLFALACRKFPAGPGPATRAQGR